MKAAKQAVMDRTAPAPAGQGADLLRALAENSSDMILHLTLLPERRVAYVNPACFTITGFTQEEFYRNSEAPGIKPDSSDRYRQFQALSDPDNSWGITPVEFCWTRKDGSSVWMEQTKTVIRDAAGRATDMVFISRDITRRKATQKALRESEERFAAAFNTSPAGISITALPSIRFVEVNEAFLSDKGYTRAEVIGSTPDELGLWNSREELERIVGMLRAEGRVHDEVLAYRTKTGDVRTGYAAGQVITLDGQPHVMMHVLDITKLKETERQLRLLSSITEQVSDATVVADAGHKIIYLNKAATDLFGYTLEEAAGQPLSFFNEKPLPPRMLARMYHTLSRGDLWTGIIRKRRKDGAALICDCRYSPLVDEEGNVVSFIGIYRDITRQQETESKLQVSKELVDSILAAMPEGVVVADGHDNAILTNTAFRHMFGIAGRPAADRKLKDILPVKQLQDVYRDVKRRRRAEGTLEFRYQKGRTDRIIACVITRMENNRTLLTFSDISRASEEKEKLYLTDRLASIGQMAAGLAHELNNPLTGILALSQMLLEGNVTGESREDLTCIFDEARRAASIVRNVLLFTRNNNYARGRANPNDIVRDVLRLREYLTSTGNITVVTKLAGDLPEVSIDRYQLQQVFLNIVLNAEAAIEAAGRPGLLTVTTRRTGNSVKVSFADNGCGIKKSVLPRIFDPFFTTKEIGKGTGLGLSICYGITVKHGGKISVRSEVGQGATFTVTFPVAGDTPAAPSRPDTDRDREPAQ
jgi:two-component system NtrC family sensor kinase